jgi:hypothetical protein
MSIGLALPRESTGSPSIGPGLRRGVGPDYRTASTLSDPRRDADEGRRQRVRAAASASSAAVGIMPRTSPPNAAISFTSDDET